MMSTEVDTLKSKSALEVIKTEVTKLTGAKKQAMTVATIEANTTDCIQRFKRGRRAFGNKTEDRSIACSVKALASADCRSMQHFEGGDAYFTKWPVRLIPVTDLKQMEETAHKNSTHFASTGWTLIF